MNKKNTLKPALRFAGSPYCSQQLCLQAAVLQVKQYATGLINLLRLSIIRTRRV